MCKLNNIKNKTFLIYHLIDDNYIGVTQNLKKRLLKHKSKSNFNINNYKILHYTKDLKEALNIELYYQNLYKCKLGVRNQKGIKNPYAKQVLDLETGYFFDTIKEASISLNLKYSSVRSYISSKKNYKLIKI